MVTTPASLKLSEHDQLPPSRLQVFPEARSSVAQVLMTLPVEPHP